MFRYLVTVVSGIAEARTLILPKTIQKVEKLAFYEEERLRSVVLSALLKSIGQACFAKTRIRSVTIPAHIREIPG